VPHLPATYILTTNVALFIKTSVLFAPLGVWSNLPHPLFGEMNFYSPLISDPINERPGFEQRPEDVACRRLHFCGPRSSGSGICRICVATGRSVNSSESNPQVPLAGESLVLVLTTVTHYVCTKRILKTVGN
jgi:hypothetical protein